MARNCHGKWINLMAKRKTSRQKEKDTAKFLRCREDILIISFAVRSRFFFLPWVFFFLPWGFSFCLAFILFAVLVFFFLPWVFSFCCREVIPFPARFFFLPRGFCCCREVFLFAASLILLPWQLLATVHLAVMRCYYIGQWRKLYSTFEIRQDQ